jgi:transcriptional regulator with XRE-family HTH domain
MTKKQLRDIRATMGLTQAQFAAELRISRNSVARMETGGQVITPSMALLISFVAREAGVETADSERSRRAATGKRAHGGGARDSGGRGRKASSVQARRR